MTERSMTPARPWGDDGPLVRIGGRDAETGYVPVHLPKPRASNPHSLADLLAEWQAEQPAPDDALAAFVRAVAPALAPQRRARFDALVEKGATVAELRAVFGVAAPGRDPAAPAETAA